MKDSLELKKTLIDMPGNKFDEGKAPVTQFLRQFPKAIAYVSHISQYGHEKYGEKEDNDKWDNWKKVKNGKFRYEQAAGRHLLETDGKHDESKFLHMGHVAWNALASLELALDEGEDVL